MKRLLPTSLTPALLAILLVSGIALAQTPSVPDDDSTDVDDSAPVARAARLSFIEGDVSFLRAGVTEWAPTVENLPLLAGDQIYVGRGARAEIQLARGNYIRLSENTDLTITALSDSSAQLEITDGTAIIRVERLSTAFGRFEVDTPNTAVVIRQDGLYRVDVRSEKNSELAVRHGEAEISTEEGTFRVREGHRALIDTSTGGKLELAADTTRDDWDVWSHDRDNTIATTGTNLAPDYVTNYETTYNDFYGAEDLSSYGTWTNYSSYGQCWIPRVASDWAPYRSGQWIWIPSAGWTWLSSEPWGWAPYHYGRWAHLSGLGWAWIPGFGPSYRGYGFRDYRWRPALVYFFNCATPRGNYVGWYPLAPGERWRRSDRSRGSEHAHLQYPSPRDASRRPGSGVVSRPSNRHGITIMPVEGFARGDRSAARPTAPGREVSDWINRGARAGLPEINPAPVASAPRLAENDRRSSRRLAVPPSEITKRSVVTRNPNTDSTGLLGGARERRWISPRNPGEPSRSPALIEEHSDRRADRRSRPTASTGREQSGTESGRERPKTRLLLPAPSEKANDDSSTRERRRTRDEDSAAERPGQKFDGSSDQTREERRRARRDQSAAPSSGDGNSSANNQQNNDTRVRERRPPATDRPHEEARQRNRTDDAGRSRDRGDSTPRAEQRREQPRPENHEARQERRQEREQRQEQPRTENRGQARQERHQEKEQQRQQQQEQRRRP